MSDALKHEKTRHAVMKLMSDAEIAKVTTAQSQRHLHDGAEFIDLEALEKGVQKVKMGGHEHMGHALPREAVSAKTWEAIVALLAR